VALSWKATSVEVSQGLQTTCFSGFASMSRFAALRRRVVTAVCRDEA
jgi:hypothetical protein